MADGASLGAAHRRDRALVIIAIALICALAWAYIAGFSRDMQMTAPAAGAAPDMPGMADMPGMGMSEQKPPSMAQPAVRQWTPSYFALMASMWAVMMAGMMLPSVTPMLVIYDRVARQALSRGRSFATVGWFGAGYLVSWAAFSVLATMAQWTLERAMLLSPMMMSASAAFGGIALIVAGVYQWTPLKDACLSQCQSPLFFIQRHGGFKGAPWAALKLGSRHGLYCIGCCWALMALLFVVGVMNLLWIAAIAIYVLLEKLVPSRTLSRVAGVVLIGAGAWMLA